MPGSAVCGPVFGLILRLVWMAAIGGAATAVT